MMGTKWNVTIIDDGKEVWRSEELDTDNTTSVAIPNKFVRGETVQWIQRRVWKPSRLIDTTRNEVE